MCTNIELRAPLSASQRMHRKIHRRAWDKCLYALVSDNLSLPDDTPVPDLLLEWGDQDVPPLAPGGYVLAVWWHRNYVSDGDCLDPLGSKAWEYDRDEERAEDARLQELAKRLSDAEGCYVVSARTAQLISTIGRPPPSGFEDHAYCNMADLVSGFEEFPSPLDPLSRRFRFSVVWRTSSDPDALADFLRNAVTEGDPVVVVDGPYVLLHVTAEGVDLHRRTSVVLEDAIAHVERLLERVESNPEAGVERATGEYWRKKYGVRLGLEYGQVDPKTGKY